MEIEKYTKLFQELQGLKKPLQEKNFLSIGSHGYYENPTSDILAFFLDPSEEHALGDMILSCLFECLTDAKPPSFWIRHPEREFITNAQNKIDLLLISDDWIMVIENKVRHESNNPFDEYEKSIKDNFKGKKAYYFVILSPQNPQIPGWEWIGYASLLEKIRVQLGMEVVTTGFSKWNIFLREFLLNLECQMKNQLGVTMDQREIDFMQKYYADFVQLMAMRDKYMNYLEAEVGQASQNVLKNNSIRVERHTWRDIGIAFQVFPRQGRKDNATLGLFHQGGPAGEYFIKFYVQADKIKEKDRLPDFTGGGIFERTGTEGTPVLLVFDRVGNEKKLEEALKAFEKALQMVVDNTD